MRLIGISGYAGSGKDTVADILVSMMHFGKVSIAEPMKEICAEVFEFTAEQLWGPSERRNDVDPRWGVSPREALQTLGSEWGRTLHADVWINHALKTAKTELSAENFFRPAGIIIPDVRFPNEARRIVEEGGEVWRIVRPSLKRLDGAAGEHMSERSLTDQDVYDRMIMNDSSLGMLEEIVLQAVAQ